MEAIKWLLIAAIAGGGGYYLWTHRAVPSTSPRCPSDTELDKILSSVMKGEISNADAETLAQSYDRNNCAHAASAIRTAAGAKKVAPTAVNPLGDLLMMPLDKTGTMSAVMPPAIYKWLNDHMRYSGTATPTARDLYMVQQLDFKYPSSRDVIQAFIRDWQPDFVYRAEDTTVDPVAYFLGGGGA